ncbi:MAG: tail fiber domain-containing protein [Candidatus Paceibacterota bacterium]
MSTNALYTKQLFSILIIAIFLLCLIFTPKAYAAGTMYAPGETLNPACGPTESGCGVRSPVSTADSLTDGALLFASSNAWSLLPAGTDGKVLKLSGGMPTWGNDAGGTSYTAGSGLVLNGSAFSLDINGLSAITSPAMTDYIPIYNSATGLVKKVTRNDLLSPVIGALNYRGAWNASATAEPETCYADTKGHYFVVSTAGNGYSVNDWAVCNSSTWDKLVSTSAISSVFGRTGVITASAGDYNALQITNTPSGDIAATSVQGALNELDSEKQPLNSLLTSIAGLTPALNSFIVGNGTTFVSQSGSTARTSLGLGSTDTPTFTGLTVNGDTITDFTGTGLSVTSGTLKVNTGNLSTSNGAITITGGSGSVVGSGTTINIANADSTHSGLLTSSDWNTFNGKQNEITAGTNSQYYRGDKTWQTLDKSAVNLSNVENTALSTWAGSSNLTTLGTITSGTWQGTNIDWSRVSKTGAKITDMDVPTYTGNAGKVLTVNSGATGLEWNEYMPTSLASGKIWIGSGSGTASAQTMSGDATLSNTGVLTIANGAITLGTKTSGNYVSSVNTGTGLTGGSTGSAGAALTLSLDINGLSAKTSALMGDEIPVYDAGSNSIKKITRSNFLQGLSSALTYQGSWNANTNTPTLVDGSGTAGNVYVVGTAASRDLGSGSISFNAGDMVIYNGTVWQRAPSGSNVASVFGRTGAVIATAGDYTALQITNTPAGNISALTVQAALNELDTEKVNKTTGKLTDLDVPTYTGNAGKMLVVNGTSDGILWASALTTSLTSGSIFIGNGSNVATATAISGDATLTSSGALAISADSVALGTDTTGNYVSGATSNGGLALTGTEGGTLGITLNGSTLSLGASGLSLNLGNANTWTGTQTFNNAIVAPTSSNTINGLIINAGALSGITGYNQSSGNFAIAGAGTFDTGTGAVNLNGNTTLASGKTLTAAGGASNFDFSASSGTFKTGTGAVSLNGNTTVATGKTLALADATQGSLLFAGASGVVSQNNANLFWDNSSARLGIGTASPDATLTLVAGGVIDSLGNLTINSNTTNALTLDSGTTGAINIGNNSNAKTITIGNTTGATAIALQTGTAGASLSSTATTGSAFSVTGNSLTSVSGVNISSSSTGLTGSLLNLSSSGNNSANTGSVINLAIAGASNAITGLNIANAGTGLSLNIQGAIAMKKGSDFSTTGVTADAAFGNTSLVRLTGASAQTIDSIAGGTDGKVLSIVNAASTGATIRDASTATTSNSGNKILTGTGSNLTLNADASILLIYDSGATRWRVIGGTGGGGSSATSMQTLSSTGNVSGWGYTVKGDATAGSVVTTLPTASGNSGKFIEVMKTDNSTNFVKISAYSGETIDGQTKDIYLYNQGESAVFRSDGANVFVVSQNKNGEVATITNWQTSTFAIESTGTAPSGGTVTINKMRWRRVGQNMEIEYDYNMSIAGNIGSGTNLLPIPSGYNIDTTNLVLQTAVSNNVPTQGATNIGYGYSDYNQSDQNRKTLTAYVWGGATQNKISIAITEEDTENHHVVGSDWFENSRRSFSLHVSIPIQGWSAMGTNVVSTVEYIKVNLTSDTAVTPSTSIVFNQTETGNIPYNSTNGQFTLKAGKTYLLNATVALTGSVGAFDFQWRTTSGTLLGSTATAYGFNKSTVPAQAIFTPSTDTTVTVYVTAEGDSAVMRGGYVQATIQQIGSTASTGVALNSIISATASGALDNLNFAQTWAWSTADDETAMTMNFNALTSGNGLALASTSTTTTGNIFSVTSASTGAFTNGGVRFNFTGAHTGNGVQIDDATTTGTAMKINANSLTTGSGLSINSSYAAGNSTNGLLYVANTSAVTNGTIARIQANSTAGSGLTVLANGNVGIGTTSPTATLDVAGTISTADGTHGYMTMNSDAANRVGFLEWRLGDGTRLGFMGDGASDVTLALENGANFTVNGGNVGIGTTSPAVPLHVAGSERLSVTTGDVGLSWYSGTDYWTTYMKDSDNSLRFYGNGADRLTINSAGYVGIGVTAPQNALHIVGSETIGTAGTAGDSSVNLELVTKGGDTTNLGNASTRGWQLYGRGDAYSTVSERNDFGISYWNGSNWFTPVVLDSTSNGMTLTVGAGGLTISGLGSSVGTSYLCNNAGIISYSSGACNSSLSVYKKDVTDLSFGLDEAMKLRPVTYYWNKDTYHGLPGDMDKQQIGFIAEEVAEVNPLLSTYNYDENNLAILGGVDYPKMSVLAIKAIQEQQAMIMSAVADITTIKEQLASASQNGSGSISINSLNQLAISGALSVDGHVALGKDTVGEATITAGANAVHIAFTENYTERPAITVTPESKVSGVYWVNNIASGGFDINVDQIQNTDIIFSWHAFAQKGTAFIIPQQPEQQQPLGGSGTTDVCPNLDGNQETIPEGYSNENGSCIANTPALVCTEPQILNEAKDACIDPQVVPPTCNPETEVLNTTTNQCEPKPVDPPSIPTCTAPQTLDTATNTCVDPVSEVEAGSEPTV